jgi:hypothetical protein
MGLSVQRFSNLDVLGNIDGVIAEIVRHLEEKRSKKETKSPCKSFGRLLKQILYCAYL